MGEIEGPGGAGVPTGAEAPEKSNEVGPFAGLAEAAAELRRLERWNLEVAEGLGPVGADRDKHKAMAEKFGRLARGLEQVLRTVEELAGVAAPRRPAVDLWAARVEALRFGWEMGRLAERKVHLLEGEEWVGPAPPDTLEATIALFQAHLAMRK